MQIVLVGNRVVAHGENCFLSMGGTVICEDTGKAYPNTTVAEVEAIPADIDTVGYEYHAGVFVPCAPYGEGAGSLMVACEDCGTPKRSKVTADADGGLNIPGKLTGGQLADDTADALQLPEGATLDDALRGLNTQKAAAGHKHAASDITSGLLPVARGGTGVNTLSALASALCANGATNFATGSYTGKGTYGVDNPNSLTFGFVPKLVLVMSDKGAISFFINGCAIGYGTYTHWVDHSLNTIHQTATWSGKTLSWYCAGYYSSDGGSYAIDEWPQLNVNGWKYHYVALG